MTFALTALIPIRSGLCTMFLAGHGLRPGNTTRSFTNVLQHGQSSRKPLDFISGPHALMEMNPEGSRTTAARELWIQSNYIQTLFEFGIKALKPSQKPVSLLLCQRLFICSATWLLLPQRYNIACSQKKKCCIEAFHHTASPFPMACLKPYSLPIRPQLTFSSHFLLFDEMIVSGEFACRHVSPLPNRVARVATPTFASMKRAIQEFMMSIFIFNSGPNDSFKVQLLCCLGPVSCCVQDPKGFVIMMVKRFAWDLRVPWWWVPGRRDF